MTDVAAGLARFLADRSGHACTVSNVAVASAGARRRNVLFDVHDGDRVLPLVATIVPAGVGLVPVTVEAAVRQLAADAGVPVPQTHSVCTDPAYVGGPFLLSERIDGDTVPRRVLRTIEAAGTGEYVAGQLGEAMARLHALDPGAAPDGMPGAVHGDPAAVALAEVEAGVAQLLSSRPVFALALRWLEKRLPGPPPKAAILHTDMRNGNIVVGPEGLRAILDWEGAQRSGDPMRDAAWPALRMWRFRADANEIGGFATRDPFVAGYERAGGVFDADRFDWWKVLGTLWWGVGLASQAVAHLDGSVPSIVMAASGRRVSEIEWDLLMLIRPDGGVAMEA